MMTSPKVAIVILNWNGVSFLEKFLPRLETTNYPNAELIVADNASTDDSIAFIRQHHPSIRIIQNSGNLGFASGYNEALQQVDADYFILLNSDVEITPNWIGPLIETCEADSRIAAVQPKLLSFHQKTSFEYAGAAGGFIDQLGYPFCRGRIFDSIEEDKGQYDGVSEIFWASGAALCIRKTAWLEAGGLDGDFFAHMEEIDLCWRLKNLGYRIMYCPESVVYHVGGGTLQADSPYKTYLNFRNNLVMLLKNLAPEKRFSTLSIRFFLDFISLLKFLADGKFKHARAINKAHTNFLLNLTKNRKKIIKNTAKFNPAGVYKGSIVWDYFVKKLTKFSALATEKIL